MSSTGTGQKRVQAKASSIPIEKVEVCAYTVPTDSPESDGTLEWDKTTIVIVETEAAGTRGLGYTYADTSTAKLVHDLLGTIVKGADAMDIPGAWLRMVRAIDRKSTRLNSSHVEISYAVFCLKKKKKK